jgi:hypothetical protein
VVYFNIDENRLATARNKGFSKSRVFVSTSGSFSSTQTSLEKTDLTLYRKNMAIENKLLYSRSPNSNNSFPIITYMSNSTTAIAIFSIWLVTITAIACICEIAGFPIPIINKPLSWDWVELIVKLCALLFDR